MTSCRSVLSLAVLLLASAPLALAQGTYTQFDVPGSLGTEGFGIDTAGDITGLYVDSSDNWHGFLLSSGTYTTIDYPGATQTYPYGVNDLGQIVGYSYPSDQGFLYDVQAQTFTIISYPNTSSTLPFAINNAGTIAGVVDHGANKFQGFVLVGSTYRHIAPPRTIVSSVNGITAPGTLFGMAGNRTAQLIFSFDQGKYSQRVIPNAPGAYVNGVNPAGTALVGFYNPSSGVTAGFIYQKNALTTLQFPGSNFTRPGGINAAGEVVGFFEDSSGNGHGFLWTPPADAAKK